MDCEVYRDFVEVRVMHYLTFERLEAWVTRMDIFEHGH